MIKKINKKVKSQKGITGADVVIALAIILTTVGVIAMVYSNLVINSREVDRKTGATRIATNIIENMSQLYYDEIDQVLINLSKNGNATEQDNKYYIEDIDQILNTSIPDGYHVDIELTNVGNYDLAKKTIVTVKYNVNGQEKKVALEKVFKRESIRECNSPNFTENYIRQMVSQEFDYQIYNNKSGDSAGEKIICPIQYDKTEKKYKIMTDTDSLWYSYSNKQWARVLVLDPNEVQMAEIQITDEMLKGEDSYIWIPRYGTAGGNPFGNTVFKYKATDYAILNNDGIYSIDITRLVDQPILASFNDTEVGRWCSYSDLSNTTNVAYGLNGSQYGPMIEY